MKHNIFLKIHNKKLNICIILENKFTKINYYYYLLLLNEVRSARLRESEIHPISPKTAAPQYQPIDRKKRKEKIVENYTRDRAAEANKKSIGPALETRQSHTIEHGVSKIVPEGH